MHRIILYIRSLFCNHDWEYINKTKYYFADYGMPYKTVMVYRCKKCGFVQKIKV